MTLREQYAELLKTARRQFGQLKRYAIPSKMGYIPSFEDFYLTRDINDRITKRDIKDLQRQIDFAKENATEWRASEEDEEDGKQAIKNLEIRLQFAMRSPKTAKGKIVAEKAYNIIESIIKDAELKYHYRYAIIFDRIRIWATNFMIRLEKMVLLMYAKEYDGGSNDLNLIQWESDIMDFAEALDVQVRTILVEFLKNELDDKGQSAK